MTDVLVGIVLDETVDVTDIELCGKGRISAEDLETLVALGLIAPRAAHRYPASALVRVRRARRLKQGLDLDWETVAVVMDLLHEIEDLRRQLRQRQVQSLAPRP